MLKKLRIKFVAVNMSIVTLMLVAIFVVLYLSTSRHMEFKDFRGPKPGSGPKPPVEIQIIEKDPELFDEFAVIARQSALNNLIKTYLLISIPVFILFLIISILLSNWMIKPVALSIKKQKRFISDASHELKTPLTIITTNAEMLLEDKSLSGENVQYTNNILTTSAKMKGLVTGLLELAKSEESEVAKDFNNVDLSKVISQALLPFEPIFFENDLTFTQDIEENVFVKGRDTDLSRLVEILLDNARKYSPPGGEVSMVLKTSGSNATLLVANTGDEIPKEEQELIFDRFYRSNKARTGMESYGLGLALAKQITTNHKGKIFVNSKDGINGFVCILPQSIKGHE